MKQMLWNSHLSCIMFEPSHRHRAKKCPATYQQKQIAPKTMHIFPHIRTTDLGHLTLQTCNRFLLGISMLVVQYRTTMKSVSPKICNFAFWHLIH